MIRTALFYTIESDQKQLGYCIVTHDRTMLEFHLEKCYMAEKEAIFTEVARELGIKGAYCKSFDHLFLSVCVQFFKDFSIDGFLFRDYINVPWEKDVCPDILARRGMAEDLDAILAINDGFFENREEVEIYLKDDNLVLFEKGSELVGCGLYQRVIAGKDDFDIGMMVNPCFRRQGYGSYIVSYMRTLCIEHNYRPICGCGYENVASRRCLEKAGFINMHVLLKFDSINIEM